MIEAIILYADTSNEFEIRKSPLRQYPLVNLKDYPNGYEFKPGIRYLVIGNEAYKLITGEPNNIHLGPRSEYFYECSKCDYMVTREGVIFKFCYLNYISQETWLKQEEFASFSANIEHIRKRIKDVQLTSGISKKTGRPWYLMKYKVMKVTDDVMSFLTQDGYLRTAPTLVGYKLVREPELIEKSLEWFIDRPVGTYIGLDYETNGIPFEDQFYFPMGVSLATCDGVAAYYDLEYILNHSGRDVFLKLYKELCDKHEHYIYTYNVGFEVRCTYLLLHKLYDFGDAATINIVEGNNARRYSLKYTAMKYLYVRSWDDDFDYLCNQLDLMYLGNKFKADYPEGPSTIDNYKSSLAYKEIIRRYPNDVDEFDRLIETYFGHTFASIPAAILAKYCTLDSFHTVLLRQKSNDLGYTEKCWDIYNDNNKLGAILHIDGYYKNKEISDKYERLGMNQIAYAGMVMTKFWLKEELYTVHFDDNTNSFEKFLAMNVNPLDSKSILTYVLDEECDNGINRDKLLEFGMDFYAWMEEKIRVHNINLDRAYFRKRSVFMSLNTMLSEYWNYRVGDTGFTIHTDGADKFYEGSLNDNFRIYSLRWHLKRVNNFLSQMSIYNPVDTVKDLDGKEYNMYYIDNYMKSLCNVASAQFYGTFLSKFYSRYRHIVNYTRNAPEGSITDMDNQYDDTYFSELNDLLTIDRIELQPDGSKVRVQRNLFDDFKNLLPKVKELVDSRTWNNYLSHGNILDLYLYSGAYDKIPEVDKYMNEALVLYQNLFTDSTLQGARLLYRMPYWFLTDEKKEWVNQHYDEIDIDKEDIYSLMKIGQSFIRYKKYSKTIGTYVCGMLKEFDAESNLPDENLVCTHKWAHPDEPKVLKSYQRFNICEKKSKRWSAGIHTLPPKDEAKRIVSTPPGYLMSYFDISGAEVRTISYLSQDPVMMDAYNKGLDPYVNAGKIITPNKPESEIWADRPTYKILLLGKMYGMGDQAMADQAGISLEESVKNATALFNTIVGVRQYIEEKSTYCVEHNGLVDTVLGDRLDVSSDPPDRWSRLGINQLIQGFSAVCLAAGFYNIVKQARDEGFPIRPLIVVHDSCINYFPTERIFDINEFYVKHFTDYLYEKVGVRWAFDTELGANYYDRATMGTIDKNTLSLKGTYLSISGILSKLDEAKVPYKITSIKKGDDEITQDQFVPKIINNPIEVFTHKFNKSGFEIDESKYKMVITRA